MYRYVSLYKDTPDIRTALKSSMQGLGYIITLVDEGISRCVECSLLERIYCSLFTIAKNNVVWAYNACNYTLKLSKLLSPKIKTLGI